MGCSHLPQSFNGSVSAYSTIYPEVDIDFLITHAGIPVVSSIPTFSSAETTSMDHDRIADRIKGRLRQGHDVAILGWKEKDHSNETLAWSKNGRVHFHETLPDSFLKSVSLVLFTNRASNEQIAATKTMRDYINEKIPPHVLRDILGAIPLPFVPPAQTVTSAVSSTAAAAASPDEEESVDEHEDEVPEDSDEEVGGVESNVSEELHGEENHRPVKPTPEKIRFAKEFCGMEGEYHGEVPAKVAKAIAARCNLAWFTANHLLQGLVREGKTRISLYGVSPQIVQLAAMELGEDEEPEHETPAPTSPQVEYATPSLLTDEPTDRYEKAKWLVDNRDVFVEKRASLLVEADKLQGYIDRAAKASELLVQLEDI